METDTKKNPLPSTEQKEPVDGQHASSLPLKKVEETGSSDAEVPPVPTEKKVEQAEEFLTIAEARARNWYPMQPSFSGIRCQLSANKTR